MSQTNHCPETTVKMFVQLTCIVTGLEVLDDGLIFYIVKKEIALFENIEKQKKRKRKYTSLFIKNLQTAFLKVTQPLQSLQSETRAKSSRFFRSSTLW